MKIGWLRGQEECVDLLQKVLKEMGNPTLFGESG